MSDIDHSKFAEFVVGQISVFRENMIRSQRLIDFYKIYCDSSNKRSIHATDILRASVVFMHASLEELLRSLVIFAHANAKQSEIDKVPLFSAKKSRQAEKFLLGSLLEHRDLSVSDLIQRSVEVHFGTQTFNNRSDLVKAMEIIGVKKELAKSLLPTLDKMLDRRHQIVHRMDRPKQKEDQWVRASSLSHRHVEKWAKAVLEFGGLLITAVGVNKYLISAKKSK